MDLRLPTPSTEGELVCSAKGCRRTAVHAVRWNNPSLHTPERRRVWLACPEHESFLRRHLDVRGFYLDTISVGDLGPQDG